MLWRRFALLVAVGLPLSVGLVAFADRASTEAQGQVIRFAIPTGSGPAIEAGITSLRRLASERLGTQLELVISEHSMTAELLWRELKAGRFDMALVPAAEMTPDVPELAIFEIPFLFEDMEEVLRLQQSDIGQAILASLANHEAFGLSFWNEGMTQLFVRHPIHEVRDLQKLKMLSFGSPEGLAMMRALGAAPSRLARDIVDPQPSDLLDFDAVEAPLTAPLSGVYLAASSPTGHITETNHKPAFSVLAASYVSWDSLPYEMQSGLLDIVTEVQAELNDSLLKEGDVAKQGFIDSNISFNDFDDVPIHYTAESVARLWTAARESRVKELVRATLSFLTESRTRHPYENPPQIRGDRTPTDQSLTTIPVYYVTDRLEEHSESIRFRYGSKRGPLRYGISTVELRRRGFASVPRSACEKQWIRSSANTDVTITELAPFSSSIEMSESLRDDLTHNEQTSDLLVFIHGYCNSFEDAVIRAGLLAADLKYGGATLAFSWPSHEQLSLYHKDQQNASWSAIDLKNFLAEIGDGDFDIHVVSHSMGSLVTVEALTRLNSRSTQSIIHTAIFAAPDVDRGVLVGGYPDWGSSVEKVTLYSSSRDLAMRFSSLRHGNPRAGEAGENTIGDDEIPIDTVDATFVDPSLFAHSYVSTSRSILTDMFLLFKYDEPPGERIDVKRHPFRSHWYFPGQDGEVP